MKIKDINKELNFYSFIWIYVYGLFVIKGKINFIFLLGFLIFEFGLVNKDKILN